MRPDCAADNAAMLPRDWDIFCRVIDNYGDAGVCWRLASQLAARGERVRLWIDDPTPLRWMAPEPGAVSVQHWDAAASGFTALDEGVVIEAFGCELPDEVKQTMAAASRPPRWINLEYLSAEAYVERSHLLQSPQWHGPAAGLKKHFFYPGFTARTGGLLREPQLIERMDALGRTACLTRLGIQPHARERVVSLFCYRDAPLPALLQGLAEAPTLLLACPGPQVDAALASVASKDWPDTVRLQRLPLMSQTEFDMLLWACDLNLVRGEDSFVRAQWAARPMAWHIYPQPDDNAHVDKLEAFMSMAFAAWPESLRSPWQRLWRQWNGLEHSSRISIPDLGSGGTAFAVWRAQLLNLPDLCSQLLGFVNENR